MSLSKILFGKSAEISLISEFLEGLPSIIPSDRILTDRFSRATYGADASFYQLIPKAIVSVEDEAEVIGICRAASAHCVPITFRAAGTSLSGQAVTDSVLVKLGRTGWRGASVMENGKSIRVGPGLIGGQANRLLNPFGRKIGPDPASINSAMMGGIAANNSSGMCCGTADNTYQTLQSMRIIFADGTLLDTASTSSREAFARSHAHIIQMIEQITDEIRSDKQLVSFIRQKYSIKNTMGYAINSFIDFTDPIDVLQHLIVGSEGTLGFIAELTLATVPDPKRKSAALVFFADMQTACKAAAKLKPEPVSAVEVMDYSSLKSVAHKPGMTIPFDLLPTGASALLIDVCAESEQELRTRTETIVEVLSSFITLQRPKFSSESATYADYWSLRKGLLPSVGGLRAPGTTVIVEDVAVPIERLADAAIALQTLFIKLRYQDAIIFGHALDGNLHFVFSQSFSTPADVKRYAQLADEVTKLIAVEFKGSLKAEHGTGRNMAPFVELEWGVKAYSFMKRIKATLDPKCILNPDVILSNDPSIHLKALKPIDIVNPIIDKCIECGFCERICPSRGLSLTPRQRIVAYRALSDLKKSRIDRAGNSKFMEALDYQAIDTCAGDSLCSLECPVGIDTGAFMRELRQRRRGEMALSVAAFCVQHIHLLARGVRSALWATDVLHRCLGADSMRVVMNALRKMSGRIIPQWTAYLPKPGIAPPKVDAIASPVKPRIILLTSCVNSAMGPARGASDQRALWEVLQLLFIRAGYEVIHVDAAVTACCGMPFSSKGFPVQATESAEILKDRLILLSRNGFDPVICDTSPCTANLMRQFRDEFTVLDSVNALESMVLPKLEIHRQAEIISLHVTCSTRKMGQETQLLNLARACAREVVVPSDIECCGFAGDKGFDVPELTASALGTLKTKLPAKCISGYSSSRTCEIGLSTHSGRHYQSIAYLLEWCSRAV